MRNERGRRQEDNGAQTPEGARANLGIHVSSLSLIIICRRNSRVPSTSAMIAPIANGSIYRMPL
jgi:hypothetical protein